MIKFCIFSEPRSGTTFFNRSINFHPEVQSFGEILPGHESERSFHKFWLDQIDKDRSKISLATVGQVFDSFIRTLFSNRQERALGFDIKYYQLEWKRDFLDVLQWEKFRIIHIVRTNILKRYVSWLLHLPENRDSLHRPMHTTSVQEPALIAISDPENLAARLEHYRNTIAGYARLFADNFPCLTVRYESMIDPAKNFLTREAATNVFDFLGVPPLEEAPRNPLKMNPDKLRYSVLNYAQVVGALAKTEFRDFLDDCEWDTQRIALHNELFLGHLAANDDLGASLMHYLRASAVDPLDAEPYYYLALTYANTGQFAKTKAMFEKLFACCQDEKRLEHYRHAHDSIMEKIR